MILPLTYNFRNLLVRKLSTVLTLTVVSVLVLVLTVLLSFAAGMHGSLAASGSGRNVIVLTPGATAESTSLLTPEEVGRVVQTPRVARSADGQLLMSQELCVQSSIPRREPEGFTANVGVRGVDDAAFDVHEGIELVEGRRFTQGAPEVIVGRAAQERYANLHIGGSLDLGRLSNRTFRVVGVFTAKGGALESEIWAPRTIISDVYVRPLVTSALLRMESPGAVPAAIEYINGPTVKLQAKSEPAYYDDLATTSRQIVFLTTVLVVIMAIGAVFAVANTMYSAVDGRRREIAMLRTIGFSRAAVVTAFVIEALLVCVTACGLGLLAGQLVDGSRQDYLSDQTWTVLAYESKATPQVMITALSVAVVVGVAGSLAPALRASRVRLIEALRKA
ncbi:MAG: ABC transporter permease [Planctomycetes bacterium]|nr:ABC transporter permease [Planctomycetota bacterium]